jgi:hypothetical protein
MITAPKPVTGQEEAMPRPAPPTVDAARSARQQGSLVLYLIVALVAFGALALIGSTLFSASVASTYAPNCATQAKYMSEAGIRYAAARLRACTTANDASAAVNDMNSHGAYIVNAARGLSFTITAAYVSGSASITSSGTGCPSTMGASAASTSLAINLPAISTASTASSSEALKGTYSGSSSTWTSGTTTGNVTTTSANVAGGSVIGGSYTYLGTGAACLDITGGVVIGTPGSGDYVCSDSCVIVEGGSIVNGDIYSQGDVTVSSTVNGNIYAGGNVYLNWGAKVSGNIYVHGQLYKPAYYTAYTGVVTTGAAVPSLCTSYTLPAHQTVASSKSLSVTSTYTFYGSADMADKSNAFTSISSTGGSKICFDLSTPNTYVNIFDSGAMTINGDVYVRTSASTSCFDSVNKVSNINFANYAAASRVYADIGGDVTFNGGSNWFGTVFAAGNIYPGGGGSYIGAFYTNKNFNPYGAWTYNRFVLSDYVSKYWP